MVTLVLSFQNSYAQDDLLFRKHLVTNAFTGLYYGIAADIIFEIDNAAAAGIPVITSGASVLVPLLMNPEKKIDYDALVLNGHGKTIGWVHGMALATLIGGENAWLGGGEGENKNYKITVGLGALSSIGMGLLGKSLARNNDWSEGRVELYRHYGWVMPFTGFSVAAAFSDEPRVFGGALLLGGAGGYLLADKINQWHNFTRGEVRAVQTLSTLTLGLGYGILADRANRLDIGVDEFKRTDWLLPAAGVLAGTLIGHLWVKDTELTPQQGMITAYAATGGALIGLGGALITGSDNITPYYLLPCAGGIAAYAVAVEMMRKRNSSQAFLPDSHKSNFQVSIMPHNLFINNKIEQNGYMINGKHTGLQPLVAASFVF